MFSDNQLKAIVDELRECLNAIPQPSMHPSSVTMSWAERREQLQQSWKEHKTKFFEDVSMALLPERNLFYLGN